MLELQRFPADMGVLPVDRTNPRQCVLSGLFEETVQVQGEERRFYTYLHPGLCYNRPCLVLAPAAGPERKVPLPEALRQSGWLRFAEKHDLFLHVLEPKGGEWRLDGSDADYMNKVYMEIQSRRYYVTIQDNIYAVGLGGGATVAQQAVMKMSSEWSGLATFGDFGPEAMRNAEVTHGGEDTGKTELTVNASKAPVPVWMTWSADSADNAAVRGYWMKQNGADRERFSNAWADEIYFPSRICRTSQINEEKIAQVRVTNHFQGQPEENFFSAVWEYISAACRHRGYAHKMLRYRLDPEAYGMKKHTMEHKGFTRIWYEYVPERVRESGMAVPLVINMHGRGGSADTFVDLSDMSRVAEERDFIVVFPESGIYQQRPNGLRNVLLWNGSYMGEDMDDVGFVLRVVEDVKQRYTIDASRIYACGQSSGGMMTSALALQAPEMFAAVSPWSAIIDPDHALILPEKIEPPVPYLFLFGEDDWLCVNRDKGRLEYHVDPEIARFLEHLMKLYGLDPTPRQYVCGEIHYYVYQNKKHVPMLLVGTVREMSHANYPRESWIAYDEFLSKFSKREDGTLLFLGEPAV